jgi:coiled-coil domain-containing protein 6
LRQEKVQLEHTLEQEQECLVNKLMRRIEKLEAETTAKQKDLETLRREKVELENTLEQEQEALVNKLWKRMDQLETEKRSLQMKLDPQTDQQGGPPGILKRNYFFVIRITNNFSFFDYLFKLRIMFCTFS